MKKLRPKTIGELGEQAVIQRLIRALPARNATHNVAGGPKRADVVVGPGDDCAVVRMAAKGRYDYLLKSDPVVEGVHFTRGTPGAAVGHKALARVLSDMAAMGAEPLWALVDIVAPGSTPVARVMAIRGGLTKLARRWRVAIVGGDVSRGRELAVHVFGVGRVRRGRAVLRSGAKKGDYLFVTGTLGGSWRGKHLKFQPRLAEGQWLQKHHWATAMIDLSDGLATDLRHLIRSSRMGAELWLNAIPLSPAVRKSSSRRAPRRSGSSGGRAVLRSAGQALRRAICDGEDYELLFTVPSAKAAELLRAWSRAFTVPCTYIGRITPKRGVVECVAGRGEHTRLKAAGYEHFR
ncbi:MAG: thiamine-phosphate kinase [Lentisphaerae bacterium]|nr:thiamine-phosphate kinase [Lentisphaerota bacterium]